MLEGTNAFEDETEWQENGVIVCRIIIYIFLRKWALDIYLYNMRVLNFITFSIESNLQSF